MSVINQVLNQLEQRGAHTVAEQAMVRLVPRTKHNHKLFLLAIGLALVAGVAVWQWVQAHKLARVTDNAVSRVLPNLEEAGNRPGSNEPGKLISQQQVVPILAPVSGVAVPHLPASQLSFESITVPLPFTVRKNSEHVSTHHKRISALPHHSVKRIKKLVKKSARKIVKTTPIKTPSTEITTLALGGTLPMKQISPEQLADAEFRNASALMQQGRIADAIAGYQAALRLDAGHDAARQALVALLLKSKRGKDAERVLQEGLQSQPDHTGFTMMLARLQVERGAVAEATATLEKSLHYANTQADYQAFLAALLQRQKRNVESIAHYQIALKLAPNNAIWLMGYGISLQAVKRNADAKVAYQHALDTRMLSPDLQAFVLQKLKAL